MDMDNIRHATVEISPRIRWAPSVGDNGVYLFAGGAQLCFGGAEALDSINAMVGQLETLRGMVLAAMVTDPAPDGLAYVGTVGDFLGLVEAGAVAGLSPDAGDHYARATAAGS